MTALYKTMSGLRSSFEIGVDGDRCLLLATEAFGISVCKYIADLTDNKTTMP